MRPTAREAVAPTVAVKLSAAERKAARQAARALSRQARIERQFRRKARRLGIEVEDEPPTPTAGAATALSARTTTVAWQLPPGVQVGPDRELAHHALGLPEPIPPRPELPV